VKAQFITRIGNYLQRWIDLAKAAETYDGVKKLFIEEQYLRTCPKEIVSPPYSAPDRECITKV